MCFILLGDFGGTNIRLYLIESDRDYKNFRCINKANYKQLKLTVTPSGQKQIPNFCTMSEPLHEFLNDCSQKFFTKFAEREDPQDKEILKNPEIIEYSVRQVAPNGDISTAQKSYQKFWAKEPMQYKNKNAKFFRLFVAVAIAGNVKQNVVEKLANIQWPRIDGNQIRQEFSFGCFYLLNDFHANGFGVLSLQAADKTLVNSQIIRKIKKAERRKRKRSEKRNSVMSQKAPEKVYLSEVCRQKKEFTVIMGMGTGLGVVGILTKQRYKNQNQAEATKVSPHNPL